jgi:two-component system CheB/CheR fusion protein
MVNIDVAAMALAECDWQGVAERMVDNRALVEDTTASIREISSELRPPALDYAGLIAAVEAYGAQFSRRTGIAVEVNALGRDMALAPDIESTLFRIVQEALTNVAKHAQAATVDIEICLQGPPLCLNVVDDGRGFDPLTTPAQGLGLINMREMAEFAGGSFTLESSPGEGTRIHVEINQGVNQPCAA